MSGWGRRDNSLRYVIEIAGFEPLQTARQRESGGALMQVRNCRLRTIADSESSVELTQRLSAAQP
jgi:hypothetical protein